MSGAQSLLCPIVVGRDVALGEARRALERARDGHGGVLLVSGEAGVGKSRLLAELQSAARDGGHLVLRGACFEADRAMPYAPLLDLVRAFGNASPPAVVAHVLAPAAPELLALWPELAPLLGDVQPRPALDPEQDRRRLLHAVGTTIDTLARTQPVVLLFEDVHWSDDATLDLVRHLARGLSSQRVLLALSYRSDEVGPALERLLAELDRARVAVELPLARLTADGVAAMVRAIFGADVEPGDDFAQALHGLTDGNPFFVEEVLKALATAGDLAPNADGHWRARSLERVRVPRTATEAVRRRLAGLSAPAREVAALAAVAGRRFDFTLLHALLPHDERALLAHVKELIAAQLVVEESPDRFGFRHALTREAIYVELLARERIAMHRDVAAAIERLHASSLDAHVEALAYHTFAAGDWPRARDWATRAAKHAMAMYAPREALAHLERAFAAAERGGESPDAALFLARGRAAETLGEFDAADADFSRALAIARGSEPPTPGVAWQALHALGMLWAARDYARAGAYRREALDVARTLDDPALLARSLDRVGNWHLNLERPHEGRRHHEEALSIFERLGDGRGVAESMDLIAMSHLIGGDHIAAALHYESSIALFEARGDQRGLANALGLLALCGPSYHTAYGASYLSPRTPELLATESPIRLAREIGWRAGEAFCRELLGECLAGRGDYDRALPMANEARAIADELQHLQWQTYAAYALGWLLLDLLSPAAARAHLERGHGIARRLGSYTWMRWTAAPLALARLHDGDARGAGALLDEVDRLTADGVTSDPDDDGATLGRRHVWSARAEIALASGDPSRALEIVDARIGVEQRLAARAVAGAAGGRVVAGVPRLMLLRAAALAALGRHDDAFDALGTAAADADDRGARPLRWRVEAERARLHRRLRHRLDARQAIDAGRAIALELAALVPDDALRAAFQRGIDDLLPPRAEPSLKQRAKASFDGLTAREREVAQLVAAGKANRAIARALGIGERTVEDHVAGALGKLRFTSRAQLAAWAVERGLATAPVGDEPPSAHRTAPRISPYPGRGAP